MMIELMCVAIANGKWILHTFSPVRLFIHTRPGRWFADASSGWTLPLSVSIFVFVLCDCCCFQTTFCGDALHEEYVRAASS